MQALGTYRHKHLTFQHFQILQCRGKLWKFLLRQYPALVVFPTPKYLFTTMKWISTKKFKPFNSNNIFAIEGWYCPQHIGEIPFVLVSRMCPTPKPDELEKYSKLNMQNES